MSSDGQIFYAIPKKISFRKKTDDMYQIYLIYLLSNRYNIQVESQSAKMPKRQSIKMPKMKMSRANAS
jgi:hypothetical protein